MDGAFPECALGMIYKYKIPFMYMNTVGFYTGSLSMAGNPSMYSVSPVFYSSYTDDMNIYQRMGNTILHLFANVLHLVCVLISNLKFLNSKLNLNGCIGYGNNTSSKIKNTF